MQITIGKSRPVGWLAGKDRGSTVGSSVGLDDEGCRVFKLATAMTLVQLQENS